MTPVILIIDDSMVLRASVRYILNGQGLDVAEAVDGKDALAVLKRLESGNQRPAMIISDINMPGMDGITFIKTVKQTAWKYIPILVLTTESQPHIKMQGKQAGAAGWLVKPFNEQQLVGVVRRFVRF